MPYSEADGQEQQKTTVRATPVSYEQKENLLFAQAQQTSTIEVNAANQKQLYNADCQYGPNPLSGSMQSCRAVKAKLIQTIVCNCSLINMPESECGKLNLYNHHFY